MMSLIEKKQVKGKSKRKYFVRKKEQKDDASK